MISDCVITFVHPIYFYLMVNDAPVPSILYQNIVDDFSKIFSEWVLLNVQDEICMSSNLWNENYLI